MGLETDKSTMNSASKLTYQQGIERLVETIHQLSLARDIETVMRIVRTEAREMTGADGATFVLKDNGHCYYADEDAISPLWKGQRFPLNACISGWSMLNKKPAIIGDIYHDERIPIEAYKPTFVKSLVMVPIRKMDPIGAIGNYWAQHHDPTEAEVKLLQALADITAVSIENVYVYQDLESRVQERTQQLEELNNDLEAFSYSVSHDLQAPLRTIRGFIDILKQDQDTNIDEESMQMLAMIDQNAGEMSEMISGLLAFFRMGKKQLEKTDVSMFAMVDNVCDKLKEQNPTQVIEFKIAPLPDVEGDTTLLRHVWTNLVNNAVKYSSKKDKSIIEIGFENSGDEIVYYVKDNGAGFDMQYAEKLFGVFQRLHLKRDFQGTGVGLATVQKIVSKHGGKIWAEAKVGEGATFFFSLPK